MDRLNEEMRQAHTLVIAAVVIAALALLVALSGSTTSVIISKREGQHARALAQQALVVAKLNRKLISQNKKLILQQQEQTYERRLVAHDLSVRQCTAQHNIVLSLVTTLSASLAEGRRLLRSGFYDQFGPKIRATAVRGLNQTVVLLGRLKAANCDPTNPDDVLPDPGPKPGSPSTER